VPHVRAALAEDVSVIEASRQHHQRVVKRHTDGDRLVVLFRDLEDQVVLLVLGHFVEVETSAAEITHLYLPACRGNCSHRGCSSIGASRGRATWETRRTPTSTCPYSWAPRMARASWVASSVSASVLPSSSATASFLIVKSSFQRGVSVKNIMLPST